MSAFLSLLVAVVGMQGGQKSYLQQVVPNPTGVNGYEDYLKAADLLHDGLSGFYLVWKPDWYPTLLEQTKPRPNMTVLEKAEFEDQKPSPQVLALAKHLDGMTLLQVQREAVQKYGKALTYLRQGNQKKVWDPRDKMDAATLFPEFAEFKNVAKFASMAAFVSFASGRPHEGTQFLLDAFDLGENLQSGVLISNLVGTAIESIALAGFEAYMPSLPRDDAATVEARMNAYLSVSPKVIDAVRSELKFNISSFAEILRNPRGQLGTNDPDDDTGASKENEALVKNVESLSPEHRQALLNQFQAAMSQSIQSVIDTFSGPESGWVKIQDPSADEAADGPKMPKDPNALPRFFMEMTTPVFSGLGQAAAKNRTQKRLLALHAAVMRYRWDNGKMPSSLEDVVPAAQIDDPLSGQKFVYEPQGPWGFRIYSVGTQALGEIGLKYRRQSTSDDGDKNVPPLSR